MAQKISTFEELLDLIDEAADGQETVSLESVVEAIGSRSFGPLLLLAGLIMVSPLSGIPGMPTSTGVMVLLVAGQLLFRKRHFWLPCWLLRRSIRRSRLCKLLKWLRRPARFADRWLRPRLTIFIRGVGTYIVAIICAVIAAGMPLMELVPFSATTAGVALAAFGLSLIAHDGLLALLAFLVTTTTGGLIVFNAF